MSITVRFRWVLRIAVAVASFAALLLLLAIVFARSDTAKRLVLEQVQQYLVKQGIVLEAANFDYSIRPLKISTGRISLRSASAPDLPPIFSADRFSATIRFYDLIHQVYRLDDLQIEKPSIHFVIDERHRDNLP